MSWLLLTASALCLVFDFQTSTVVTASSLVGLRQQQLPSLRSSRLGQYDSRVPVESAAASAAEGEGDAETGDESIARYAATGYRRMTAAERRRDERRQRQSAQRWTGDADDDDERIAFNVLKTLTQRRRPQPAVDDELTSTRASLDHEVGAARQLRSSSRYASQMDEIARTLSQSPSGWYAPEDDDDENRAVNEEDEERGYSNENEHYVKELSFNRQQQQQQQQQGGRRLNPLTRNPEQRLLGWFRTRSHKGKRPLDTEGYSLNPLARTRYFRRPPQ